MLRGIYTGASSMAAKDIEMDVIANNLANANTTGYKQDVTLFKAFPEMLLRRINDDGVVNFPLGSFDKRPLVSKLGTGVEVSEVFTQFEQGNMIKTENPFDMALAGKGFIAVETPAGERYTRNASFMINPDGYLVTKEGHKVLGENGPIQIKWNNFTVKADGTIHANQKFLSPPERQVSENENGYEDAVVVDKLKVVDFDFDRYLKKEGGSFYRSTDESGSARLLKGSGAAIQQGFIEAANVNPVNEMVRMIEVQRAYEASQKTITSHDQLLDKLINQMGVV